MADQELRDILRKWIEAARLSLYDIQNEGKQDEKWIGALMQSCENILDILGWEVTPEDDEEHDRIVLSAFMAGIAFGEHRNRKPDAALYTDLLRAIMKHQERGR